jgi:hypothetical protein
MKQEKLHKVYVLHSPLAEIGLRLEYWMKLDEFFLKNNDIM